MKVHAFRFLPLIGTLIAVLSVCKMLGASERLATATGRPPNVIVILADDMGYGDIKANNAACRIPTPHLDRLVAEGMNFTDAHTSSAVCTPSRYSLLTGRYNWRTRLKWGVLDGFSPPLIGADEPTVASELQRAGYATACIGKWHLGMQWMRKDGTPVSLDRDYRNRRRTGEEIDLRHPITGGPNAVGFDYYYGISASLDMSPYAWIENEHCLIGEATPLARSAKIGETWDEGVIAPGFEMEQVLAELRRRTMDWIKEHTDRNPGQPFFMYLPLNSPHLPVVPSEAFRDSSGIGMYGDFVVETDHFVGGVVEALKGAGQLDNTLIIFTSDNGGLWHDWDPVEMDDVATHRANFRGAYNREHGHQSNDGLRGTKAQIWEGGHRVPFIVHWPERVVAGGTCDVPVEVTDIFATIMDASGQALSPHAAPDSFSFLDPLLHGGVGKTDRPFLVHHSMWGMFALRDGDWKYMEARGSGGFGAAPWIEVAEGDPLKGQLYNLKMDVAETHNLYAAEPARVKHFEALLSKVRAGHSLRPDFAKD